MSGSPASALRPRLARPRASLLPSATISAALLLLLPGTAAIGAEETSKEKPRPAADTAQATSPEAEPVVVREWLQLGPWTAPLPALAPESYDLAQWLAEADLDLDGPSPAHGQAVAVPSLSAPSTLTWTKASAKGGELTFGAPGESEGAEAGGEVRVVWLATYLEVDRFTKAKLDISGTGAARVLVDGVEVATRAAAPTGTEGEGAGSDEASTTTAELELETGRHLLLIESASQSTEWTVGASVGGFGLGGEGQTLALDPQRGVALADLLDATRAGSLELSPDGKTVAIAYRRPAVPAEHTERWTELVSTDSGEVVRTLRGGEGNFEWHPGGDGYVFAAAGAKGEDIYRVQAGQAGVEVVARGIEHLQGLHFLPDGSGLVLEVNEPTEPDERGVKRYRGLPDRWSGWREKTHLHLLRLDGTRVRLTVGDQEDAFLDISPDGRRLLLQRVEHGRVERPYSRTELIQIDLGTLEAETLMELGWFGTARYSPEGDRLLITGSAALFDGAGSPLPAGTVANDYDTQAYLYDLESGEATAITRDFAPAINDAHWSHHDGNLYFGTQDEAYGRLYRYRLDAGSTTGSFEVLDSGVDVAGGLSLARHAGVLVYSGQSPNRPPAVWVRGSGTGDSPRLLADPSTEAFGNVAFGEVRNWSFEASDGTEIAGRIYLPTGFDPAKKYPAIVYYYGGTVPVSRSFGGRYPKELWAANGYVVYVPQPSGATGFGAEFAARHVNAWGRRTADEIIEGTKKFLAAHDFVDAGRVGSIGASYGGFMTLFLQTRTDLFAAAISHAGISNISSYWGKGWWGYLYSAAASAGSFPWNNPELYTEQSPLYAADRIDTPLLLLHGDADTNVPPSESHQMYTALQVLGKEVELIEIGGENHTILTYPKRQLWAKTILAWFDRHLKEQPAAWEHLWGTDAEPKG